jgi:pyrroloquinoline quinone (PQQ) biosynthesis protein C
MDQKHHWAFPALTRAGLTREQLFVHFRHEYLVYIRDFPVLLARALGQAPPIDELRFFLAENLYEEQTGGLSATAAHPRLFLRMMEGLSFDVAAFADDDAWLHPMAREYRDFLHARAAAAPWQAAVTLLTIFVEGSINERAELAGTFVRRRGEDAVREHPLVKVYGCPAEAMDLARAHACVEGRHRELAWEIVLRYTPEGSAAAHAASATSKRALELWQAYRDGVAERMGLGRDQMRA